VSIWRARRSSVAYRSLAQAGRTALMKAAQCLSCRSARRCSRHWCGTAAGWEPPCGIDRRAKWCIEHGAVGVFDQHERRHRFEHADFDLLSFTGALAVEQRHHGGVERCEDRRPCRPISCRRNWAHRSAALARTAPRMPPGPVIRRPVGEIEHGCGGRTTSTARLPQSAGCYNATKAPSSR
jgi:hypothetical protein